MRQQPKGENGGRRLQYSFHTPSNFALIKEDVGGVAGYVGVLLFLLKYFFYKRYCQKRVHLYRKALYFEYNLAQYSYKSRTSRMFCFFASFSCFPFTFVYSNDTFIEFMGKSHNYIVSLSDKILKPWSYN